MPQNVESDQGLHHLLINSKLFCHINYVIKMDLFKYKGMYGKELRCLKTYGKYSV